MSKAAAAAAAEALPQGRSEGRTFKMLFTHEILTQISLLWRRLIELISPAFEFQTAEMGEKKGEEWGRLCAQWGR